MGTRIRNFAAAARAAASGPFVTAILWLAVVATTVAGVGVALALLTDIQAVDSNTFASDTLDVPTGLGTSASSCGVVTTWTATTDTYASGHRVLRGTVPGGPYAQVAETTPRSTVGYTDNPSPGTYYYVSRAFFNNWVSADSNQASAVMPGIGSNPASSADTGTTTATSLTFAHTVSGCNRFLVVGVSVRNANSQTVSGVTYGGVPLSKVGSVANVTYSRVEIWRLVAPATGSNNVVVALSAAARFVAGAASFTGVHQTVPMGTFFSATGNSVTASVAVTGVNEGEVVIDTMGNSNISQTAALPCAGAGQTQLWVDMTTNAAASNNTPGAGSTEPGPPGGGSVTMSWNIQPGTGCSVGTTNRDWSIGAVAIKPVQ